MFGLLYLDFIDACRGGYRARVEKCIECFALLFQGSIAKNHAAETMHLVACLKKTWKPEFKYVALCETTFPCLTNDYIGNPGTIIV